MYQLCPSRAEVSGSETKTGARLPSPRLRGRALQVCDGSAAAPDGDTPTTE
jgi:hypothetical protein